jgi:hypothetical protein
VTLAVARTHICIVGARKFRRLKNSDCCSDQADHDSRDVVCGGAMRRPGGRFYFFPRSRRLGEVIMTLFPAPRRVCSVGARKSRRFKNFSFCSDQAGHDNRAVVCGGAMEHPGGRFHFFPRSRRLGEVFMTLFPAPRRVCSVGASKSP